MELETLPKGTIIITNTETFRKTNKGWRATSGHLFKEPYGQNPRIGKKSDFKLINPPQELFDQHTGLATSPKAIKNFYATHSNR